MPAAVIAVAAAVAGGAAGTAAAGIIGGSLIAQVAAGAIVGAVVGGAVSAVGALITGQDVGKAFKSGLISGGISGGLAGAFSAFGAAKGAADTATTLSSSSPGITAETATTSGDFMKGFDLSGNVGVKGADFSLPATADAVKAAPAVLPGSPPIAESAVSPELAGAVAKQTVAGQQSQTGILSGAAGKVKGALSGLMPTSDFGKTALLTTGLQTTGNLISGAAADKAAEAEAEKDALHRSRVNAGISTAPRVMDYRMGSNGLSVTRFFSPSYGNKYTEAA